MKFRAALLACIFLAGTLQDGQAGILAPILYHKAHSGGGAYSGPGDVVGSAVFYAGLRAYTAAKATAGVAAVQLCTASDALCTDIHVTSTGGLSSSDLTTSGCSAINTCTIKIWYDQAGTNNQTIATIADRATFKNSCIGSLPCGVGAGNTQYASVSTLSQAEPFTILSAAQRTGNFSTEGDTVGAQSPSTVVIGFSNSANTALLYAGSVLSATAADTTWHALQGVFNTGSSILAVDATQTSGASGGQSFATENYSIMSASTSNSLTGYFVESGIWGGAFTSTQLTNMSANVHSYWGF